MEENVIHIENVSKTYNPKGIAVKAVRDVSLEFKKGEFTAIVGPSGSGKTTLLNLIGGLDTPTNGKIIIDGTDISKISNNQLIEFRRNHIGFVFQAYNLIPVFTAYENTEFVMLLQGTSARKRKERVEELMEAVGLTDKMYKRPRELSGGQQQRVAVARALAPKPTFILADEPTANLDSKSTSQLLDLMADLNEKEKITFIFSTHDQRVMDRAKRIIHINDGKISKSEQMA